MSRGKQRAVDDGLTKGQRTREALLAAAIERFARDGFRSTSMRQIAHDAGLTSTAAYAYFDNKEALFEAAVDEDAAAMIDAAIAEAAELPEAEFGRHMAWMLYAELGKHPLARRVLAGREPDFTTRLLAIPALEQLRKASVAQLEAAQLAGTVRADIDAARVASGLTVIVLSLLMSALQTEAQTLDLVGDDIASVFEAILGPLGHSERNTS